MGLLIFLDFSYDLVDVALFFVHFFILGLFCFGEHESCFKAVVLFYVIF